MHGLLSFLFDFVAPVVVDSAVEALAVDPTYEEKTIKLLAHPALQVGGIAPDLLPLIA
jgi:hypothetical protein